MKNSPLSRGVAFDESAEGGEVGRRGVVLLRVKITRHCESRHSRDVAPPRRTVKYSAKAYLTYRLLQSSFVLLRNDERY